MSFVVAGLSNPTTATVPRRPGSVRRTSHIDMLFDGPFVGGRLVLSGRARDLLTDVGRSARVLGEADVVAALDETRHLRSIQANPSDDAIGGLVGAVVGRGFRAQLDSVLPAGQERSPLYLLLDDLPVATLISGYAGLYDSGDAGGGNDTGPGPAGDVSSAWAGQPDRRAAMVQSDICSGWRSDGTMMVALTAGRRMPAPVGPPAPDLSSADDPWAWHDIPPLRPRAMRRRRLIDVTWGDPVVVAAMFRDTHKDPDGAETVLHEYTVDATVDPSSLEVLSCVATPRSLPWVECPFATASARRLEGQRVGDLRRFVRQELTGISTCTHLNDLLRSLADIAVLVPALEQPGSRSAAERPTRE
jgi:hypothetical protein